MLLLNFLIKLSLRERNIAILVRINITVASNMFSVFSKGNKLHCVIGIHDNGHMNEIIGPTTGSIMANLCLLCDTDGAAEVRFTYPMSRFYL